jgi:hypothetical protein
MRMQLGDWHMHVVRKMVKATGMGQEKERGARKQEHHWHVKPNKKVTSSIRS